MVRLRMLPAVVAAATLALPASAGAAYSAGFGQAVTTPPLAGTPAATQADAAFAPAFATLCPAPLYPERGRFALQEPFRDANGNKQWDDGELYCDANANGHWDGIYTSGQIATPATGVHDDIDVRAFAVSSDGGKPLVYASVVQQGLFENYTDLMRKQLADTYHVNADLVVSADHNESSPDTVGIYGADENPAGTSTSSGIDEYFMAWLEDKVARAASDAVKSLAPAQLYATQVGLPDTITQRFSQQFPTFDTLAKPPAQAAVDTKIGVLQARAADGSPIFTVMSYAAHNQEMGRVGGALSGDWPLAFARAYERDHGGHAMFLVGDNGSQEDPSTNPEVIKGGSENHGPDQYTQAQATGERFAQIVSDAATGAVPLAPGSVTLGRTAFCVPLENQGFVALAAIGVFGSRPAYVCDQNGNPQQAVPKGQQFRTYVSVGRIGPDLELIANPGEAFPALTVGSNWGQDEASCSAANPPAPTWHGRAAFRLQVGLADDMIGYEIPAWAYVSDPPGLFPTACQSDAHGQKHGLEDEGVGPTGSNDVATRLTALLDKNRDPIAHYVLGRYVLPDGTVTRRPAGAVALLLPDAGKTTLSLSTGRLIALPSISAVGGRAVDANGLFMDYDGQPQTGGPGLATRGMVLTDQQGLPTERDYVSVFEPLSGPSKLPTPQQTSSPAVTPQVTVAPSVPTTHRAGTKKKPPRRYRLCMDRRAPVTTIIKKRSVLKPNLLVLRGVSRDLGCKGHGRVHSRRGRVVRVALTISRKVTRSRCRFVGPDGRLGRSRPCGRPIQLLAHGTRLWTIRLALHPLPAGRYRFAVRAYDRAGNREPLRRGRNYADIGPRRHH